MKRIKVTKNDKVTAFDFNADLLEAGILFEICRALKLSDIYVDVYGANIRETDIGKLAETNNELRIATIEYEGNYAIKATIDDIPAIVQILGGNFTGELNVWDTYTDWQKYLKDKKTQKDKTRREPDPNLRTVKVYLNYNSFEGNKIELYLDPCCDAEEIKSKLEKIVSANREDARSLSFLRRRKRPTKDDVANGKEIHHK